MVPDRPLVAARDDQHRPVLHVDIVEHDADGGEVVVGVRVECPVLVPFHRRAETSRFHVQLAGVEADAAPEILQDRDHLVVAAGAEIGRVNEMRRLQPPHARLDGGMRIFEIIDLVIGGDRRRVAHELVGDPAQLVGLGRREDIRYDNEAVPLISGALRIGEHRVGSPYPFGGRPARRASTAWTAPTSCSA